MRLSVLLRPRQCEEVTGIGEPYERTANTTGGLWRIVRCVGPVPVEVVRPRPLSAPRCRRPPRALPGCRRCTRSAVSTARARLRGSYRSRLVPVPARTPRPGRGQFLASRWRSAGRAESGRAVLLQAQGAAQRDRRLRALRGLLAACPCGGRGMCSARPTGPRTSRRCSSACSGSVAGSTSRESVDRIIGCIAITQPVFFAPDDWVPTPDGLVAQRSSPAGPMTSTAGQGRQLWEACLARAGAAPTRPAGSLDALEAQRSGAPRLIVPRLGQASFRLGVLDAYGQQCAVTTEHSLPVLEAAHIRPWSAGGAHALPNGLPLRSDLHRLFDLGYVTSGPTCASRSAAACATSSPTAARTTTSTAARSSCLRMSRRAGRRGAAGLARGRGLPWLTGRVGRV